MKGDELQSGDHVARYCKPSSVQDDLPTVTAFEIKEAGGHLSVNWLEYFAEAESQSPCELIPYVRDAFLKKGFTLRPSGRFAVLSVGLSTQRIASAQDRTVSFLHWPEDDDESHSGIFGYGPDDLAIRLELKNLVTTENVFAAAP